MPRVDSDLGLSLPGECNKRVVTWGNNPKVTEEPALFRDSVFNDIGCCLDGSSSFLYMYFDNSGISSSQENKTGVWDSNYNGVWHFPNGTTLSANDSTADANNGTINGATATTGKIGGAASFNGTSSEISLGSTGLPFPYSTLQKNRAT